MLLNWFSVLHFRCFFRTGRLSFSLEAFHVPPLLLLHFMQKALQNLALNCPFWLLPLHTLGGFPLNVYRCLRLLCPLCTHPVFPLPAVFPHPSVSFFSQPALSTGTCLQERSPALVPIGAGCYNNASHCPNYLFFTYICSALSHMLSLFKATLSVGTQRAFA